jgi:hypothetical protein
MIGRNAGGCVIGNAIFITQRNGPPTYGQDQLIREEVTGNCKNRSAQATVANVTIG